MGAAAGPTPARGFFVRSRNASAPITDLSADPAASVLVAKVWNLAHVLNNAGVGAGDYAEQVTYLLFLKLDQERVEEGEPSLLAAGRSSPCWPARSLPAPAPKSWTGWG